MGYSATRRRLLRRTRHDDSSGGPSDSFLVAVAALDPVLCGCLLSAVPGENYQAVDRNQCRGVVPYQRPQTSRLGKAARAGILGGGRPMVAAAAKRYPGAICDELFATIL
jgi:hypothetical protein